jgi:hypothetical protein
MTIPESHPVLLTVAAVLAVAVAGAPTPASRAAATPATPAASSIPAPSPDPRQQAQLARARTLWSAQYLQSYRFRLRITCDCPPASDRPVEITVRHGRPRDARYFPGQLQTFPEMFRLIGQVLADPNSEGAIVRYDPHRGFPRAARIDAISWTVDRFQPLPAH